MKKINSLPCFTLILFFVMSFFINADAQTADERLAVKNWIIANKDKITLVSSDEYKTMSPAVRVLLDKDPKTLVYDQIVKTLDIQKFIDKNPSVVFSTVESSRVTDVQKVESSKKIDQIEVENWIEHHPDVKIIQYKHYTNASQEVREQMEKLPKKIIHHGKTPTKQDISSYEKTGESTVKINNFNKISAWAANNPKVKIISLDKFNRLNKENKDEFNAYPNKIIYKGELSWADIHTYQNIKKK